VYHVHCGSSGEWSPLFTYHVEKNKVFVNLKNNRWFVVLRVLAILILKTLHKAFLLARRRQGAWEIFRAYLKAWATILPHTPEMLIERFRIRVLRRKIPDREIARFIVPNP
jgi:GT2 family glycosyltransferase